MTSTQSGPHIELARELREHLSGEVRFDTYSRRLYSTDASMYEMEPVGVVAPRDEEDVMAAVRLAGQAGVSLLPRGGGTSLAGQTVNHGLVMDFSKYMSDLVELNTEEHWAWVQPGIVQNRLRSLVAPHGLNFGPDPATSNRGTIGGAIGNNSCGSHSVVYGKTLDHVMELEVVLADGTFTTLKPLSPEELEAKLSLPGLEGDIYRGTFRIAREQREEIDRRFPKIARRVSGYNLDEVLRDPANLGRLAVGSEGTLLTVTRAKVNLVSRPKTTALAVLHFHDLVEAMSATVELLKEPVTAIELMDKTIVDQGRSHAGFARRLAFVEGNPAALLVVEVAGESREEVEGKVQSVVSRARNANLGYHTVTFMEPAEQANVWSVRENGLGLIASLRGDRKPLSFVEDTAVAPEKLPEYIARFDQLLRENGTTAAYYGHASVGCVHIRPMVDIKKLEGREQMVHIMERVSDLVLEFGGALSGEHGDGIVRGYFTEKMFGPQIYQAFRDLKRTFDPQGVMNPGKIIDTPHLLENFRPNASPGVFEPKTTLDFSHDGGFGAMVDMCNGQGACRKTQGGTMCPSYMVTREEEHSTRGRANALRAVLAGTLPASQFTSKRLHDVLDLCLECKGCKAECPSSVDMAKLKYEFLSHYNKAHGIPLRARLFADIARLNRVGTLLAPLSNWAMALPGARWAQGLLGIDRRRRLPPFASQTFTAWFARHTPDARAGTRGRAVFFNDTFTEGNYPSVGAAATRLLERAGYEVLLVPRVCCGRPMISKGMLDRGKAHARRNVDVLHEYAASGAVIVGTEPSCVLTLRDEYPDLLPGDAKAQEVARSSFLLDEFLAKLLDSEQGLGLEFTPHAGKVLFHGHCHQKAEMGVEHSVRALRLVPGAEVEALDSGCCGMAGAFGFEKEHYEISMQVGERVLFPAVRNNPEATVVVMGVSCRQQVEHATGVRPLHLAEFLARQLEG